MLVFFDRVASRSDDYESFIVGLASARSAVMMPDLTNMRHSEEFVASSLLMPLKKIKKGP